MSSEDAASQSANWIFLNVTRTPEGLRFTSTEGVEDVASLIATRWAAEMTVDEIVEAAGLVERMQSNLLERTLAQALELHAGRQ